MTLEIRTTVVFDRWFANLSDRRAKARIQVRIDRMALGHFGDIESVGSGIAEMRIFHGPGYRVYFLYRKSGVVILLNGGDKSTQRNDIARARAIASQLER